MVKNILVICDDTIKKNRIRKILVKSNIVSHCTFKSCVEDNLKVYDIILVNIEDFETLAKFKLSLRVLSNIPVLNIIEDGEIELFHLIEDKSFKIVKIDFHLRGFLKNDIRALQNVLTEKIHLTEREEQILNYISMGFSTDDISLKLGISSKTVITHKRNLFIKANVHSINQLLFWSFNRC